MTPVALTLAVGLLLTSPGIPKRPPLNLIDAATLLSLSPAALTPVPAPEFFPSTVAGLHSAAIALELLDPREARYVLAAPADFAADITLLRRRARDLAGVPLVADSERFPERTRVNELVRFNRLFRQRLIDRRELELDRRLVLDGAINETDQLYRIWDAARDARCEFFYVTVRRTALKSLREMIGEEAYRTADMPPNVPIWRFNDLPR